MDLPLDKIPQKPDQVCTLLKSIYGLKLLNILANIGLLDIQHFDN